MPFPATTATKLTLNGFTYPATLADQGNGFEGASATVAPALLGTMTGAEEITFPPGHGLSTGMNVELYWSGGSFRKVAVTMTGDVAALNLAPGSGDPLPAVGTPVTVMPRTVLHPVAIDGDRAQAIGAFGAAPGYVIFIDSNGNEIPFKVRTAGDGPSWTKSSGTPNPFAAALISWIVFSHSSTSPRDMRAGVCLQ